MLGQLHIDDDDDGFRNSLEDLLSFAGYRVRAWREPWPFLSQLQPGAGPGPVAVITDMRMPGLNGLQLHQALRQQGCDWPVVYISGASSVQQSIDAMKLGAVDFLVKPFGREELLRAVERAIERSRQIAAHRRSQAQLQAALATLTPREQAVYHLLRQGYNHAEIMSALAISLPTAKQHKASVMRKLGARSLLQLMQLGQSLAEPGDPAPAP